MASLKKPAIAIAVAAVLVAGGVAAISAPIMGQGQTANKNSGVFGIKPTESVFGYMRQAAWREIAPRIYAVAPPRPEADFREYAVQYDPDTNKVCAVIAATESEAALARLKSELTATYGEPVTTPANGWHWSKGADSVEIEDIDTLYHVYWDFSGNCHAKNKALAPDIVTVAKYD